VPSPPPTLPFFPFAQSFVHGACNIFDMFSAKSDRMFTENAQGLDGSRVPLHNIDNTGEHLRELEVGSASGNGLDNNGTWGERDIGGLVNLQLAMVEYEDMRRELSTLSKSRTSKSNRSNAERGSRLRRISMAGSRRSRATSNARNEPETDLEALDDDKSEEDGEDDFELGEFLKDGHFEKRQAGKSAKKVGLVYKNLTVKGVGATTTFVKTLPSAIIGVRSSAGRPPNNDSSYPHCK
jgi:ATP-binding cassette subfamily G (WHITE) protein 2 (SNQ2)